MTNTILDSINRVTTLNQADEYDILLLESCLGKLLAGLSQEEMDKEITQLKSDIGNAQNNFTIPNYGSDMDYIVGKQTPFTLNKLNGSKIPGKIITDISMLISNQALTMEGSSPLQALINIRQPEKLNRALKESFELSVSLRKQQINNFEELLAIAESPAPPAKNSKQPSQPPPPSYSDIIIFIDNNYFCIFEEENNIRVFLVTDSKVQETDIDFLESYFF